MAGRVRLSAVVTCGLAVSCAIGLPARADTTLNSGTTTLSTGTDFGATLSVGTTGTATLAVVAGGSATAATAYLGSTATGNGTVTVSGGTLACTSQLWIGDGSGGGTLRAANGMLLEQGKNLTGRGTVYGNFINQGHVYGDGAAGGQTIVFAAGSTVSGIGSFENVVFSGTYAPGNSPAITSLAGGQFSSSSALVIELGGLQPGTQYDRVVDSGSLNLLGGALDVMVFNGFVPALGDSFEILQYGQLSGDFGMASYPALGSGLSWERTTSATAMTITVVPEPSVSWLTFVSLAFGGCAMRMCRGERFYEQVLRPTVHCPEDTSH